MEGWLKKYEKGGNLKVEDINNQQPQIKPARGKVEQFLLNLAGGWEENKPQLMKDVPLTDITIGPLLDYISGKSDVPVMPIGTLGNIKTSSKYFDKLYHYSDNPNLQYSDVDLYRVGKSQMKKRYAQQRSPEDLPGGFYSTKSPYDTFMGGNIGYSTSIPKNALIKDLASEGRITDRLPISELKELRKQGYDIIKGKNMIGKEEWIPLNKNKLIGWDKFTENRQEFRNLNKNKNGGEVNANEEYVSIPPNFVGSGYDISGRRFSPAWGGQFEDGGALQKIAGYHPIVAGAKKLMSNFSENVTPFSYENVIERIVKNGILNKKDEGRIESEEGIKRKLMMEEPSRERIDLLKILANEKQKYNSVPNAEYTPSNSKNKNTKYYKSPQTEEQLNAYINNNWIAKPILSKKDLPKFRSATLGNIKLDYGTDEKGNYISYYDKWDLNPVPQTGINWIDKTVDKVVTGVPNALGITNTPEVYGRVYLPEKRNGGELKKLEDLTNFGQIYKNKWLQKYK